FFHKTSVHRGIWHSLLAGVFTSVATAIVFHYVLHRPEGVAWLAAGFMMTGYVTHLVLDEVYSVDVMDTRIKASFGTALKLFDRRYPWASLAMTAATAAAIMVSPPTKMFVDGVSTHGLWSGLQQRLLPSDKWFGVIAAHRSAAGASQTAAPELTTGSITKPQN
ncbi:MAG: metal-dependent hydrolase, partial [Hyphomicrobium sp.]